MKKVSVAVTGIGLVSPLGSEIESFWKKVARGESAIAAVREPELMSLGLAGLARVENFVAPKRWEAFDRQIQFAVAAGRAAFCDAALAQGVSPERLAVFLSSSKGGVLSFEAERKKKRISEKFFQNYLSSSPSSLVAEDLGCHGPVVNFVSACASGAHALMMAARRIEHDPSAIVLAGATEASLTPLILSGFRSMGVLALKNSRAAEKSFAPFDVARSGFVAAEGSAILVLESRASAEKRGVPIYCELVGSAALSDSTHPTRFDPTGASIVRLIERACEQTQIPADAIDYVNLHGTATKENDIIETRAVKKVWGLLSGIPALSATKPITGHLLGASGAIEAVISVLTLTHQFIPPTLNWNQADTECDLDYTPLVGRKKNLQQVMSLSYGFGGHMGALIFGSKEKLR